MSNNGPWGVLKYSSNNSGGSWWLNDKDWKAMESAGWVVDWKPNRWMDALATSASIPVNSMEEAKDRIREWETLTRQNVMAMGCSCCGKPHEFWVDTAVEEYLEPITIHRTAYWD